MDVRTSNLKGQMLPSKAGCQYLEAYDEAVNVYFKRDLQAWGKLKAFHERFLVRAWEVAQPDEMAGIGGLIR